MTDREYIELQEVYERVFSFFTEKTRSGNPSQLCNMLFEKFYMETMRTLDICDLLVMEEYLKNVVVPHKIVVYDAGMEMWASPWFSKYLSGDDVDQFKHNLHIHDLSKFSPAEVFGYMNYDRKTRLGKEEFEKAWHHHKMNNPHHPEYWFNPNRQGDPEPIAMPTIYVLEMMADWIGAGKTYGSTLEEWLPKNLDKFRFGNSAGLVAAILFELGIRTEVVKSTIERSPILHVIQ